MKANWWSTFYSTKGEKPFTNASGALEQSIYIGNFFRGLYVDEFEDYKVVPLGLYGGLTFNVLVPEEGISYESLLGNEQCYRDLISRQGNKKEYNVHVEMPEFEAKASYNLKKYAISKGVVSPFDPIAADFSSMAYVAKEDELYIAKAIHEAGIGVDKTGIEAAAYTKIEMEFVPVSYEENPRLDVILNRPFIYSITDRNGLPLFIGNVNSVV
jgi:serpin B